MHPDLVFIDKIVLHQSLHRRGATVHLNVPAGLLLQRCDFLRDIALDECGVPLQWLLELLRRYALRNCVHALEIWPLLDLAPRSRKKLVSDASAEEIVALH